MAVKAYVEAEQFYSTYRDLRKKWFEHLKSAPDGAIFTVSHPVNSYQAPMAVLEAYATELLLKALLLDQTEAKEDGHDLLKLFRKLPAKTQAAIKDHYSNAPQDYQETRRALEQEYGVPSGFDERLSLSTLVFVDHRYRFESDVKGKHNLLSEIVYSLRDYIETANPHWLLEYPTNQL